MSDNTYEHDESKLVDPAARERPVQDEAWRTRAVQLAGATSLPIWWGVRFTHPEHGLVDAYEVGSKSTPEVRHSVEIETETGNAWCTCTANTYGRPCSHVGTVLEARERERLAKQAGHECSDCDGVGIKRFDGFMSEGDGDSCPRCDGTGWVLVEAE